MRSQTDFDSIAHLSFLLNMHNSITDLLWYKLKTMASEAYLEHGKSKSPIII